MLHSESCLFDMQGATKGELVTLNLSTDVESVCKPVAQTRVNRADPSAVEPGEIYVEGLIERVKLVGYDDAFLGEPREVVFRSR